MKNLKDYIIESAQSSAIEEAVKHAMSGGFLAQKDEKTGKIHKYGISKENIYNLDIEITHEELERLIKKYEADGIKWKYKTDKEWQDAGFEDPNGD